MPPPHPSSTDRGSRLLLPAGIAGATLLVIILVTALGSSDRDRDRDRAAVAAVGERELERSELELPVAEDAPQSVPVVDTSAEEAQAAASAALIDDEVIPDFPKRPLSGRVVAADGGPLPPELEVAASLRRPYPRNQSVSMDNMADITRLHHVEGLSHSALRELTRTPVAEDGHFSMVNVPTGGAYLEILDDRLHTAKPVVIDDDTEDLVVTLVRGALISGRVVDTSGAPLAEATVSAGSAIDPFAFLDEGIHVVEVDDAETDEEGRFLLRQVPPDVALRVRSRLRRYEPTAVEVPALPPDSDHEVEIAMVLGGSVAGRLLDEEGLPIAEGRLQLQATKFSMTDIDSVGGGPPTDSERTDDEGHFLFESVTPGEYRLIVTTANYRPDRSEDFEVASGQQIEGIDLVATRGLSVSGRVVATDGAPLPDAQVMGGRRPSMTNIAANMDRQYRRWIDVDEEGRFELSGYDEGALRVWVQCDGHVSSQADAVAGDSDVLVTLKAKTTLEGIAIGLADAEPITDYTLSLVPSGGVFDMAKIMEIDTRIQSIHAPERIRDPDGRFKLEDVTPGEYDLTLKAQGYAKTVMPGIEIAENGTKGVVIMVPEEARVTGIVVSSRTGDALEGATVTTGRTDFMASMTENLGGAVTKTLTDAEGRFELGSLGTDPVTLTVTHRTHQELPLPELQLQAGELRDLGLLTLPAGAAIWGHVYDAHKRPEPEVRVMVNDNVGKVFKQSTTDARGVYRIDGLAAGTYNVIRMDFAFDADMDNPGSFLENMVYKSATVAADEEKRVDLTRGSTGGTRLEGTVRSSGVPESGAMLWLIAESGDPQYKMGTTDETGDYAIDGLQEGNYLMQVLPIGDDGMSMSASGQPTAPFSTMVDVGAGPVQRKDVELPGGRLRAEVVDKRTGDGLSGVRVVLERTDDGLPSSRFLAGTGGRVGEMYSDEDGHVEFRHVAGGSYALVAGGTNIVGMGAGGWSTTRVGDVEVSESRSGFTVRIEMETGGSVAGNIKDLANRPLSGIPVWARNDATGEWLSVMSETTSDNAGRYEVGSLDAGPWTLVFGGTTHALTVVDGIMVRRGQTTDLDVTLEPGVEIWVDTGPYTPSQLAATVVGSQGVVPTSLSSLSSLLSQQATEGRIRVGRVPAGAYEFWVHAGDEQIAHQNVQLVAGSPHTITLGE